jgi:hypothetical protein
MAWKPTKPAGTDPVSSSASDIRDNWAYLDSKLEVNHRFSASGADDGYHKFVDMPNVGGLSPVASDGRLYVDKRTTFTANPNRMELIFNNVNQDIQISGPIQPNASGYSVLPGGIIIQWGNASVASGATVAFVTAFAAAPYSLVLTAVNTNAAGAPIAAQSVTATNFVVQRPATITAKFNWIAIGK